MKDEATIFEGAKILSDPTERARYLDAACQGDPAMRERIEQMLLTADKAQLYFGETDTEPTEDSPIEEVPVSEGPGTVIGRYKLLQKIGEGGMGIVYMAEQTEPVIRKVALKIIKLGMDTRKV